MLCGITVVDALDLGTSIDPSSPDEEDRNTRNTDCRKSDYKIPVCNI